MDQPGRLLPHSCLPLTSQWDRLRHCQRRHCRPRRERDLRIHRLRQRHQPARTTVQDVARKPRRRPIHEHTRYVLSPAQSFLTTMLNTHLPWSSRSSSPARLLDSRSRCIPNSTIVLRLKARRRRPFPQFTHHRANHERRSHQSHLPVLRRHAHSRATGCCRFGWRQHGQDRRCCVCCHETCGR